MPKVKLYIPEALEGAPLAPWFAPLPKALLFTADLPPNFFETEVERVSNINDAEAIVLPNNFKMLDDRSNEYIAKYATMGANAHVPVFVFSTNDLTDALRFDERVYPLRFSIYRSTMQINDISIPTSTEDPPQELLYLRDKADKPLVAFCGQGAFKNTRSWVKYFIKNLSFDLQALMRPYIRAQKIGVYWRRRMMAACERSTLVNTHFIVRRSFSSIGKTIELDPKIARKEYLEATAHADFVLAPKGDGNYSNRFLKTLAFGRIPIIVDTDVVLPFEDVIDYSKIVIKVPMRDVHNTPRYIADFYNALTNEGWQARQELARDTYNKYLRQDAFFHHFFTVELPRLRATLA